ncbi:hypothetical protein VUR80DRAFT_1291 [Thermomyces stellatus]
MRTFTLICLALLATIGAAFDALAWTRSLDVHNSFVSLVSRSPKGGGRAGGGFGGGSSGGDDDGGSSSSCSGGCSSGKSCGNWCIPSNAECCPDGLYCPSGQRCVASLSDRDYYKCCPKSDRSCDAQDASATFTEMGEYRPNCDSGATLVKIGWALGAVGIAVALDV